MLGILFKVFEGMVIIKRSPSGLLRLSLKGVRVYFSGLERDPAMCETVRMMGGSYLLLNYYYIRNKKFWTDILSDFKGVVIDSGAFTLYKKEIRKEASEPALFDIEDIPMITVEEYANFINRYSKHQKILGFFNLDVVGDPLTTKENFEKLKRLTPGATVYPVWQFTDSLEQLELIAQQEPELVGIGGMVPYLTTRKNIVKKRLEEIFRRFPYLNFHFLGGANELLLDFPFFSSDTTAYLNSRKSERQRKIYLENGERIDAPGNMQIEDIIKQNINFLFKLERRYRPLQECLF